MTEREEERNLWVSSADDWALTQQGQGDQERALHTQVVPDHGSPSSLGFFAGFWKCRKEQAKSNNNNNQELGSNGWWMSKGDVRYIWGRVRAFKELTAKRGMGFPCCEAKFWKAQMS